MTKRFSIEPPKPKTVEEFISQATDEAPKPWEAPRVREDVVKLVSLRLSEPEYLKLKYLSEKSRMSQQEIIKNVLVPWLEEELKKY